MFTIKMATKTAKTTVGTTKMTIKFIFYSTKTKPPQTMNRKVRR
jgi:hypothetical protein